MGVEIITARILQEAKDEAAKVIQTAQEEKTKLLDQAAAEIAHLTSESQKKASIDAQTLVERRNSVAELEGRKMRLAAKQDVIEEAFKAALSGIHTMDPEKYYAFLLTNLEEHKADGGQIRLNEADLKTYKERLAKDIEGTKLTIDDEPAKIEGGFILKQGDVFVNASLEKLLDTVKKQITAQIASVLF